MREGVRVSGARELGDCDLCGEHMNVEEGDVVSEEIWTDHALSDLPDHVSPSQARQAAIEALERGEPSEKDLRFAQKIRERGALVAHKSCIEETRLDSSVRKRPDEIGETA
jgi:hypothetical protein